MRDYRETIADLHESADWADRLAVLMGRDVGDSNAPLMRKAADAIEELVAAVPKWISVEERMPEEWREVLVYIPIHSDEKNPHMIQICWYIGNGKWRETEYGEIVEIPVTHWMPLPDPPKEVV